MRLIFLPPGPMTAPILSTEICILKITGAYGETDLRGSAIVFSIWSMMNMRPSVACLMAWRSTSSGIPVLSFTSIWKAVIPLREPVSLKSISPRWSSRPIMSDRTTNFPSPLIAPMAIPEQGDFIGTPASNSASEPPHTEAMEEEPLDSVMSDTTRMVYGNSSSLGIKGNKARRASSPWPISRRPGERSGLHSPVAKPGKL